MQHGLQLRSDGWGIYCETALTLDQTTVAYCKANTQDAGGIYLTGAQRGVDPQQHHFQ